MRLYANADADIAEGIEQLPKTTHDALMHFHRDLPKLVTEAAIANAKEEGRTEVLSGDIAAVFTALRQGAHTALQS